MPDKDDKLIFEAMADWPGYANRYEGGSHEKGVAMELIRLYLGIMAKDVKMTEENYRGLIKDRWKEIIADDDTDVDKVLGHLMDQPESMEARDRSLASPSIDIIALYREAEGEM